MKMTRPVYLLVTLTNVTQDKEFMMEKIGTRLYHYKFVHDLTIRYSLYKFTKKLGEVEIDSAGNLAEKGQQRSTGIPEHVVEKKLVTIWEQVPL
jgi:hypothetical protein